MNIFPSCNYLTWHLFLFSNISEMRGAARNQLWDWRELFRCTSDSPAGRVTDKLFSLF